MSYFGMQVTMALDQFIAVFWPFQHARLRRNLNRAMLVLSSVVVVLMTAIRSVMLVVKSITGWYLLGFVGLGSISALVLMIAYPATAYKLYRQSNAVRPQSQIQLRNTKTIQHGNIQVAPKSDVNKSQMHVQALKIYTAILLQFLISTLLCIIGFVIFHQRWMIYICWINHIGNPVIYYCFVPKFREGVNGISRKLFHWN